MGGRQYWVIIIVFLISLAGQNSPGTYIPGIPNIVTDTFLSSGVACILLTAMVGQLNTQVNSARCMLDFINTHAITLSVYLSMVMEASGLLHVTYLFQMAFAKILDEPIESNEAPMNTYEKVLFWGRSIFSTGVLIFCCLVNAIALWEGKTTMWEG